MSSILPQSIRNVAMRASALLVCAVGCANAQTAPATTPLLDEVHTIAAPTTAIPIEHQFDIATTGTYQVVLTDFGAAYQPSEPLAAVKFAVTTGATVVGTPQTAAGVLTFTAATAGTYVLHVVGSPNSTLYSSPIGIQIGTAAAPTLLGHFSDDIVLPAQAIPSNEAYVNDSLNVASSGTYTVSLTDFNLPQSLRILQLLVIPEGTGGTPILTLPDPTNNGALQGTVALTAGVNYTIIAAGQVASGAPVNAGLFSAVVAPSGGGDPVYAKAVAVGNTTLVGSPTLTAGAHTLAVADLAYPAALTQVGATLIYNGQSAAQLNAPGSQTFTANAATYQLFVLATPVTAARTPQGTTPAGAGSYAVQVQPLGGAPEISFARGVTAPDATVSAYNFDTSIPAGGAYVASLQNFPFPVALVSANLAAAQAGALLGTPLTGSGNLNISAGAGPITLLAFAQADPTLGGLFDVNVTASGSSTLLFDMTQAVGNHFSFGVQKLTVTTAGSYDVAASDVGFPANFTNFAVIVTQGSNSLGSINSLGKVTITASPGDYYINLIAQPSGTDQAGTYSLTVVPTPTPPAPTVMFSSDSTSVAQGGTATLTWSAQNATSCTASNGWSGTEPLSGSAQSSPLSAATTFTLTCTGAGGSTAKSVTVTVTSSHGGGGGAVDVATILALLGLVSLHLVVTARRHDTF